jgi:hypothetical protein
MNIHGNAKKKNLDDNLPFQAMVGIFVHIYSRGFKKKNRHLLIMDGHGFHVTI